MLDVDGTIYQTIDVKERAWHATIANTRSIGIEIANIGAYPEGTETPFSKWYSTNERGEISLKLPPDSGVRTPNFISGPLTQHLVNGTIQNTLLSQYDLTPQQYSSLPKLVAALIKIFPRIKPQFPVDHNGVLIDHVLNSTQFLEYSGLLFLFFFFTFIFIFNLFYFYFYLFFFLSGHFHVQSNKVDPGPAFQWFIFINLFFLICLIFFLIKRERILNDIKDLLK